MVKFMFKKFPLQIYKMNFQNAIFLILFSIFRIFCNYSGIKKKYLTKKNLKKTS